ncbi:uncharacterized protein LOC122531585 [Frieseomelitta varia]|uniref:uncharacterized protein LOC122531585 n=1 Tax=Frieseomelitta varia TaxID=561572 RepID=UPI001CB69BEE|nr:uncharacterized protein LOC122531585 [Frieseomelitta varia]
MYIVGAAKLHDTKRSGNAEERKWNSSGKMKGINLWEDDLAEQISGVQLERFRGTTRYRGLHERYVTITEETLQQITRDTEESCRMKQATSHFSDKLRYRNSDLIEVH